MGNLLFAQSGGPTAVINASACGVIRSALKDSNINRVYGARYGIDGVLTENFVDVGAMDATEIDRLMHTPASAFGSCRRKLPALEQTTVFDQILDVFVRNDIRYFVYIGGNDSMDTVNKIAKHCTNRGYQCCCVGVPKTIDNDLASTDHCPGYGSSAKYIATTMHEIALDTAVYAHGRVTIVETMGRDTGWLVASSMLATAHGAGPDLIYVPEIAFDIDSFVVQCQEVLSRKGRCLVAIAEGIKDSKGQYISTVPCNANDSFAHAQLGGASYYLASYLMTQHNITSRAIELSLPQRCASHMASKVDIDEAYLVGSRAVELAVEGNNNIMVSLVRISQQPYIVDVRAVSIDHVANTIRHLPAEYIAPNGGITDAFLQYASPLIQGETAVQYDNGLPVYSKISVDNGEC